MKAKRQTLQRKITESLIRKACPITWKYWRERERNAIGSSSLRTNSRREAKTLSPLPLPSVSWCRLPWRSCGFFKDSFQSLNVIRKQGRAPPSVGTGNSHPHSYLCLHTHTHTHTHTRAQDLFWKLCYINSMLFCQLHLRLLQIYQIRHQKHNTKVQLPHNSNNYHKTVTAFIQHFLWAVSKTIHNTALNIPSASGGGTAADMKL